MKIAMTIVVTPFVTTLWVFIRLIVGVWGRHEREKTGFQKPEKLQVAHASLLVLLTIFSTENFTVIYES